MLMWLRRFAHLYIFIAVYFSHFFSSKVGSDLVTLFISWINTPMWGNQNTWTCLKGDWCHHDSPCPLLDGLWISKTPNDWCNFRNTIYFAFIWFYFIAFIFIWYCGMLIPPTCRINYIKIMSTCDSFNVSMYHNVYPPPFPRTPHSTPHITQRHKHITLTCFISFKSHGKYKTKVIVSHLKRIFLVLE